MPSEQPFTVYRAAWPIVALLVLEVLAVVVFAPPRPGDITLASICLATIVLLAGLTATIRAPSLATQIVGCSAVALASVLWRTNYTLGGLSFENLPLALAEPHIRLGFLNVALLTPLTLHLAVRFPQRSAIHSGIIASWYGLTLGMALAVFLVPAPLQQVLLIMLASAAYAGFGFAGYQLLQTIQTVQTTSTRTAQQARLLLLIIILAEAPLLLLPLGYYIQLLLPYEIIIGGQILVPLGIAYIIVRRDLFGIDTVLRRGLDYILVSVGLLAIYFGSTAILNQIRNTVGGTWGLAATILSVLAAAAAFTPLRQQVQWLVDRLFYPERLAFGQTISAARLDLSQVVQQAAVITLIEHDLPQRLGATWAKLVLRPSFDQPEHAPQPGVWNMLLMVGGQSIGSYWLGPRRSGLPYTAEEQEQLQNLLQQAALALAYAETVQRLVQLNHELEERVAIRTDHVLAQHRELAAVEERQRLARDLHDSVKQTLFSLGVGLRSARNRLRTDPDAAHRLLEQHEQTIVQTQVELGELLSHLRTTATGSSDLVVLLEEHSAWLQQQHGMTITQQMPQALVLPEPLPRELMQIAREALYNTLRHSGVTAAHLTLKSEIGQVTLTIADQGSGFDPAIKTAGHGLRSMHERVALLGGSLKIQSTPGKGTTLWIQVPQP
jgi:signal transduction histidine kinase